MTVRSKGGRSGGAVIACVASIMGCSPNTVAVQVRSFEQAQDMAFLCFEAEAGPDGLRLPLPLERCVTDAEDSGVLHGLVTQGRRGELASVDLTEDLNGDGVADGRVLDLDGRVPGFTFFPVGELPQAVVAPESGSGRAGGPTFVYVANRGSQTVSAVPADRLLRQDDGAPLSVVPSPVSTAAFGGVSDLLLSGDGQRLFGAVPDAGVVLVFPIGDDGTLQGPTSIPLPAVSVAPVDATAETDVCYSCAPGALSVAASCGDNIPPAAAPGTAFAARDPIAVGTTTRPIVLVLDDEDGVPGPEDRVWVADAGQPLVHVLNGVTGALESQFSLSVPLVDLAITPRVPSDLTGAPAVRYIYGIDATDQSVLVADYDSRAVLPVTTAPGRPLDRVPTDEVAVDLEVVTPTPTDEQDAGSLRLNGVFVAVAFADGFYRIIDVEDREIENRDVIDGVCNGEELYFRRHRLRFAPISGDAVGLGTSPRVSREGEADSIEDDGTSRLDLGLGTVGCDATELSAFGDGLLCLNVNPWALVDATPQTVVDGSNQSVVDEQWTALWEGALPGGTAARGALQVSGDGASATLAAALDFCAVGALGSDNSSGLFDAAYGGDMVTLLDPLPPAFSERCEDLFLDEFGELGEVSLPVADSFEAGLRLGAPLPVSRGGREQVSIGYADIIECFGSVLPRFAIEARDAYLVREASSPIVHPVAASVSEDDPMLGRRCLVEMTQPGRSRAVHGSVFSNGRLRLRVAGEVPVFREEVELTFTVRDAPRVLAAGIGTLPAALIFNPVDQRLYAVDAGVNGVIPYELTLLARRATIN